MSKQFTQIIAIIVILQSNSVIWLSGLFWFMGRFGRLLSTVLYGRYGSSTCVVVRLDQSTCVVRRSAGQGARTAGRSGCSAFRSWGPSHCTGDWWR